MRAKCLYALLSGALVVLTAIPAAAQDEALPEGMDQEMMEKWAEYATPGEPHQRLAEQVGEWDYTMKWWMGPGAEPVESTGTMSASMTMDGRYLVESWEGMSMGQLFKGQGITGYDNFNDKYVSVWIDNSGTGMMTSTGQYDAQQDAIVMTGTFDDVMTGEEDKTARSVSKQLDDDTFHFEMYVPAPGGEEYKNLEIHATRKP